MEWVAIIISLISVGVAVWAAISSSKSAQKQISAVMQFLEVFMTANTPQIISAKHQYEQELSDLNHKITDLEEDLQVIRNPFGYNCRIDAIEELEQNRKTQCGLDKLNQDKERLEEMINVLQEFLNKRKKID